MCLPQKQVGETLPDRAIRFGDQLQTHVDRLARAVGPHVQVLDRRFVARLRALSIDARQSDTLLRITPGAAVRCLRERRGISGFFDELDAAGRSLAKLNLPPHRIVEALDEYDALVSAQTRAVADHDRQSLQLARQQLLFCTI